MKTHLSLSQRIHNAVGSQQAENIHARHSYLHGKSFAKEEWGQDLVPSRGLLMGPCIWPLERLRKRLVWLCNLL